MPRKIPPVPVPAGCKFCFRCTTVHRVTAFGTERRKPDGLASTCRACVAAAKRERLETARLIEELLAESAAYRALHPLKPYEPPIPPMSVPYP